MPSAARPALLPDRQHHAGVYRELTRSIDRDRPCPRVWLLDEISGVTRWTSIRQLARDNTAFGGDTVIATGSRWAADEDLGGPGACQ